MLDTLRSNANRRIFQFISHTIPERMAGHDFCDYCLHNSEEFNRREGMMLEYPHIEPAQDPPPQAISKIRYFQIPYKKAFF